MFAAVGRAGLRLRVVYQRLQKQRGDVVLPIVVGQIRSGVAHPGRHRFDHAGVRHVASQGRRLEPDGGGLGGGQARPRVGFDDAQRQPVGPNQANRRLIFEQPRNDAVAPFREL